MWVPALDIPHFDGSGSRYCYFGGSGFRYPHFDGSGSRYGYFMALYIPTLTAPALDIAILEAQTQDIHILTFPATDVPILEALDIF